MHSLGGSMRARERPGRAQRLVRSWASNTAAAGGRCEAAERSATPGAQALAPGRLAAQLRQLEAPQLRKVPLLPDLPNVPEEQLGATIAIASALGRANSRRASAPEAPRLVVRREEARVIRWDWPLPARRSAGRRRRPRSSSSCVPCSTMRPSSITRIRSASRMVLSRCAMTMRVHRSSSAAPAPRAR